MGIRNFHIFGKAYSESGSDVTLSVSIEGYGEVFNGAIPTLQEVTPGQNLLTESLASWAADDEVPVNVKTLTIVPSGGDVFIISSGADKFNSQDLTTVVDFNGMQTKSTIQIDGVDFTYSDDVAADGGVEGWHVFVLAGETLTMSLTAPEIAPNLPGGLWPTDLANPVYATYNHPTSNAGLLTPSYEQGDAVPAPITPPV